MWDAIPSIIDPLLCPGGDCLPTPEANITSTQADAGFADAFRGWYDVQGCGKCNDYCQWVGGSGSGGDPALSLRHQTGHYAQVMRGSCSSNGYEALSSVQQCTAAKSSLWSSCPIPKFRINSGSCTLSASGSCVKSTNYGDGHYPPDDHCKITVANAPGILQVVTFYTENGYDYLDVGPISYSGNTLGPAGVSVALDEVISWTSDYSVQHSGWEICLETNTASCASSGNMSNARADTPVIVVNGGGPAGCYMTSSTDDVVFNSNQKSTADCTTNNPCYCGGGKQGNCEVKSPLHVVCSHD